MDLISNREHLEFVRYDFVLIMLGFSAKIMLIFDGLQLAELMSILSGADLSSSPDETFRGHTYVPKMRH